MGETQERERVLAHFSQRYFQCNPEALSSEGERKQGCPTWPQRHPNIHVCKACRVHMYQCKMQLHACGAVQVAGMLLGQGCFEKQVEMCLHEVVSCVCAGPGLTSVLCSTYV